MTPTGTVTFQYGSLTLGVATLNAGTATFSTCTLIGRAGLNQITAVYNGDSNVAGSTPLSLDANDQPGHHDLEPEFFHLAFSVRPERDPHSHRQPERLGLSHRPGDFFEDGNSSWESPGSAATTLPRSRALP